VTTWTLDLRDRTGGALIKADVAFKSLTAKWVLNAPGALEAEFRHDADLGGARIGTAEFQLKRDGVVVWAGPWRGTDVDARAHRIRVNAEGLHSWFRSRIVTSDLVYTATAQQEIAWNLLNHTQGQTHGSLGIVQGTHTGSTINRDRFYCSSEAPNIGEEVEAFLAYSDGFDFEINPATRAFNTWAPSRMAASGISLSGSSVDHLTWTEDVRDVQNYVTAIGNSNCGAILVTVSDAGLAASYGRLHGVIDADDADDTKGEVTAVANEGLRVGRRLRMDANVIFREHGTGAPAFANLIPGNTLLLSDNRGYSTFTNVELRMVEIGVSLDNGLPGEAVFDLALTSAVA